MQRSISSEAPQHSRRRKVPPLCRVDQTVGLLGVALFLFLLPGSARGEDFIDDARIKADFERELARLYEAGGLPSGASLLRRLRQLEVAPLPGASANAGDADPGNASADAPSATSEVDAVVRARAASLVFGHLYLCGKCDRLHTRLAGAVAISAKGLALTNHHVIDSKEALVFGAMTPQGHLHPVVEILAASKEHDIAVVRLGGASDLPHVSISSGIVTGDPLFVVSHPDGHFFTLTRGHLARRYLTPREKTPRLQITADFARGSSGSGIFDRFGRLAGLAVSTNSIHYHEAADRKENLQMVAKSGVPAETILRLLADLPHTDRPKSPATPAR